MQRDRFDGLQVWSSNGSFGGQGLGLWAWESFRLVMRLCGAWSGGASLFGLLCGRASSDTDDI